MIHISDIKALRKLKSADLTLNQRMVQIPLSQVKEMLYKVQQSSKIFTMPTQKNVDFVNKVNKLGGYVSDKNVRTIVRNLDVDRDYKYCKYSYMDWDSLLFVFNYKGSCTFDSIEDEGDPVIVNNLKIYIKLDVETETNKGYVALSFHELNVF